MNVSRAKVRSDRAALNQSQSPIRRRGAGRSGTLRPINLREVSGIIVGGNLYTKKTLNILKASFDSLDPFMTGKINLRDYLNSSTTNKKVRQSLDLIIASEGIKRET
jgi:hypothetical protein